MVKCKDFDFLSAEYLQPYWKRDTKYNILSMFYTVKDGAFGVFFLVNVVIFQKEYCVMNDCGDISVKQWTARKLKYL